MNEHICKNCQGSPIVLIQVSDRHATFFYKMTEAKNEPITLDDTDFINEGRLSVAFCPHCGFIQGTFPKTFNGKVEHVSFGDEVGYTISVPEGWERVKAGAMKAGYRYYNEQGGWHEVTKEDTCIMGTPVSSWICIIKKKQA